MIDVALATSSGTRKCASCGKKIVERMVLLMDASHDWFDARVIPNGMGTPSIALHPRCARVMADKVIKVTGGGMTPAWGDK